MTDPDPRAPKLILPEPKDSIYGNIRLRIAARGADATEDERAVEGVAACMTYAIMRRRPIIKALCAIGFERAHIERVLDGCEATDIAGRQIRRYRSGSYYMRHPNGRWAHLLPGR